MNIKYSLFLPATRLAVVSIMVSVLTATGQVVVRDGFESGTFSTAWDLVSGATIQTGTGAAGTTNYATLAATVGQLGARYDAVEAGGSTNFSVDCYFRLQSTTNRQFSLIFSTDPAQTGSGATAVNLRYQAGWAAYDGSAWQTISGLGSVVSNQWYHFLFRGTNWGKTGAAYYLSLSDAGGTNFTSSVSNLAWSQDGSITTASATYFEFSTVSGSNPGFDVDQITAATTDSILTLPAGALNDPRYGLGYLVVTNYPGVRNDGTGDCQPGIQAALNDAYAANAAYQKAIAVLSVTPNINPKLQIVTRPLAVFFPPGTYQISNILTCYQWTVTASAHYGYHVLVGSTEGAARPKIILAAGATNYQSAAAPWPMISFRCFSGSSGTPVPVPNPMSTPAGYAEDNGDNFWCELRNIDFDCNGNPGAVGVVMSGAQGCGIENVKVSATNALAGFYELPGAGCCVANLAVYGGKYGIVQGYYSSRGLTITSGTAGPTIAGVTLANQTVAALLLDDEISPVSVVGFNITNCSGHAVENQNYYYSSGGTVTLLDGQITMSGGSNPVAITNASKNFYARNVYVSGTTNIITSGSTKMTGLGTWSHIVEYSRNSVTDVAKVPPNTGYKSGAYLLESYAVTNGVVVANTNPFPVSPIVVTNSSAPPINMVSHHLWVNFPSYNGAAGDPPTVVVSTNAGWKNTNDATVALQAAIDSASTSNAVVFLPAGLYYITNTVYLHTNTVLLGVSRQLTEIVASQLWKPTTGEATMMQSDNSASATTTLAYLSLIPRVEVNQSDSNYARIGALTWQAGSNSVVVGVEPVDVWVQWTNCQPRAILSFTNNGGGKWYGLSPDGPGYAGLGEGNPGFRYARIIGTTQPLWFYGFQMDYGNSNNVERVEITGASNVRFVGLDQESTVPYLVMTDCTNIAAYSFGNSQFGIPKGNGFFQVLGNSTNILLANLTVESADVQPGLTGNILYEAITGKAATNVLWPNNVSLYKRGNIDDTLMMHGALQMNSALQGTVPSPAIATAGNQATISWTGGGTLESADQVTGPYLPVAGATSPYLIIMTNDAGFFRVVQ